MRSISTAPFTDIIELAHRIVDEPDTRPAELRRLRDAEHPTTLYYRFLHRLCETYAPLDILEIGTYCGTSAAHMAAADARNRVTTVDIQPDAKIQADSIGLPNLTAITADSSKVLAQLGAQTFDLIYVDGWHDFNQTYGEYVLFRPSLRDGGLMIFDDVGLEMAGDQMNVFWSFVVDLKTRADHLHPNTGFGICRKQPEVTPPPWSQVINKAQAMMSTR